jgi:hypothetical protein
MNPLVINTREDGVLDHTTLEEVRDIAHQVVRAERAVLHVHGGLVSRQAGLEAAQRLSPFYATARILSVFPVWESGLGEVLRNHGSAVFNETLFRAVLTLVLKHAGGKLRQLPGARQGGYVPLNDRDVRDALDRARAAEGVRLCPNRSPAPGWLQAAHGISRPRKCKTLKQISTAVRNCRTRWTV